MTEIRRPERRDMALWDGAMSYAVWDSAPDGAREAVALHANGFNAETWRSLIAPLSADTRFVAPDLRGHGLSTLTADPAALTSWLVHRDDIVRLLDGFDGRPRILIGHSMGATAALLTAAIRPDLVRALVLLDPVIVTPGRLLAVQIARAFGLGDRILPIAAQAARRRAEWPDVGTMVAAYRGRGAFKGWPEETLTDYARGGLLLNEETGTFRLACAPDWEAANFRAGPPDVFPVLARVRCPVTLIHGRSGSTCPAAVAARAARGLKSSPAVRVVEMRDAGHFLPMTHQALVRAELARAIAAA